MTAELYVPRGGHPPPPGGVSVNYFTSSGEPTFSGFREGDLALDADAGTVYRWTGSTWEVVSLSGGGGSGDPQVFKSTADPTDDPGVNAAIHYRTDTGAMWIWNGSAWEQILGG